MWKCYKYRDEIFIFRLQGKIDFCISLSKDIKAQRVELQISLPFRGENNYIIIGEFYYLTDDGQEEILKIIKAILSNDVKAIEYFNNDKLIKTDYYYGYYIDNNIKIIKETFKNKIFFFSYKRNYIKKYHCFKPWILTEFTIKTSK